MNKKIVALLVFLTVVGVIGTGVCAIQFAMAVRFMELGRCLVYFILTSLCIETVVFSVVNLVKKRK